MYLINGATKLLKGTSVHYDTLRYASKSLLLLRPDHTSPIPYEAWRGVYFPCDQAAGSWHQIWQGLASGSGNKSVWLTSALCCSIFAEGEYLGFRRFTKMERPHTKGGNY